MRKLITVIFIVAMLVLSFALGKKQETSEREDTSVDLSSKIIQSHEQTA